MHAPRVTALDDGAFGRAMAEHTTQAYLDAIARGGGAPMETLSPEQARGLLADAQTSVPVELAPAVVSRRTIGVDGGEVPLIVVRPVDAPGVLPAFMFFHGGGWVLGDFPTHERLVRNLVAQSGAAAVFVEYSRSPEVRYPVAIHQAYGATQWVAEHGSEIGVDGARLSVAGNSAGANMATVVALRAKLAGGPALRHQALLWPVTDARFATPSHEEFAAGYALTRGMMRWFWDHYTADAAARDEIFTSPLRATLEQLAGLPPALVQTAELDVLRDEGEAYARKLEAAGVEVVSVRVNGMIHDYGLLNPPAQVPAVRAAMSQAAAEIRRYLA